MNVFNLKINTIVMCMRLHFLQMTLAETTLVERIRPVW